MMVCLCLTLATARCFAVPSIARIWNEQTLSDIRLDRPHPPVHARNLFSISAAMYDAWAAYDGVAVGFIYHLKHMDASNDSVTARREAISYAAYRILSERYALSLNAATTLTALTAQFTALGYNPANTSTDTSTAAGVGNAVAAAVSAWFLNDGARQLQGYADFPAGQGGYESVNPFMLTGSNGTPVADVNRWQPLAIANAVDQNGNPTGPLQSFQGPQWIGVRPFSLTRTNNTQPWSDPGPPPHLNGAGDAQFRSEVVEVIQRSSELTPDDGVMVNISPGALGNNSLGTNNGSGHPANPATGLPYAPNVVKRGDFARVLAEYWADGPNSETPPGHWNVIANAVSDYPAFLKRIGGSGPIVDGLEWDVKVYFALNAAVHDAACAAWSLKRHYDGWRPISAIRYMGQLGQSSDPGQQSYNASGLPLVPGLIELVTTATSQPGARHQGIRVGAVAIYAWPGQPANPATQYSGVKWTLAASWLPYQKNTFVTPGFPGYISGHSTFSRSAAEVMTAITGSPFFPGGMGTRTVAANTSLSFEQGPSQALQLQWGTYYDAADQAGLSRLWGGIHVAVDDLTGRLTGSQCGKGVWALARRYFDGSIKQSGFSATIYKVDDSQSRVQCEAIRGFHYKLQTTTDMTQPFVDDPAGFVQCTDSPLIRIESTNSGTKFFRYVRILTP